MSKNKEKKPKEVEVETEAPKVESEAVTTEAPKEHKYEAILDTTLGDAYRAVVNARNIVKDEKVECKDREIHIALTDIEKSLTSAIRHFKFIDISLATNEQ